MGDPFNIAQAVRRASVKKSIANALEPMPKGEWQNLVVEVLVEAGVLGGTETGAKPRRFTLPPKPRPKEDDVASTGKTAQLVEILTKTPGTPIATLAERLYGHNDAHTNKKTRSLLVSLARQNRARAMARGRWEIVLPKD